MMSHHGSAVGIYWSRGWPLRRQVSACSRNSPEPLATVSTLLASNPFYIAHRGEGRNWPEMTAYAYDQAAGLPYLKAIEDLCLP